MKMAPMNADCSFISTEKDDENGADELLSGWPRSRFCDLGVPVGPIAQEKPRSGGCSLVFDRAHCSGEICSAAVPSWKDFSTQAPTFMEQISAYQDQTVAEHQAEEDGHLFQSYILATVAY
jgi:hypothetical protein